ncbi:hypothetical protein T12_9326 [Trichinella patagoniensis]|uniref:Uncharacterized protein n=1 Tax=Trichinella patagoniensis TaxID=990121 RepID=A0A0V0YIH7_9BILA|nr:hypothetical protein T12_9326 [Trichinella patagoniensis]
MLYIQHILLNTPSIISVYRDIPPQQFVTRGSSSTHHGGQLATWSTHRDYLCLWHSLKS